MDGRRVPSHSKWFGSFVRTQLLRDKLLLHMCAVALTIDQFSFNITTLAKDLKMQPKQCVHRGWRGTPNAPVLTAPLGQACRVFPGARVLIQGRRGNEAQAR